MGGQRKTREEIRQELFLRKRSRKNNRKLSTLVLKHREVPECNILYLPYLLVTNRNFPRMKTSTNFWTRLFSLKTNLEVTAAGKTKLFWSLTQRPTGQGNQVRATLSCGEE